MAERLLLVEDDQNLVDGLVYALQKAGYVLDVAGSVAEAQAALAEKTYDL